MRIAHVAFFYLLQMLFILLKLYPPPLTCACNRQGDENECLGGKSEWAGRTTAGLARTR